MVDLVSDSTNGHGDAAPEPIQQSSRSGIGVGVGVDTGSVAPSGVDGVSKVVADWSFANRPFWLFSHLFALSMIVLFVGLGFWQLSRHDERQSANELVGERIDQAPLIVSAGGDLVDDSPSDLAFRPASVSGTYLNPDFARVVNRSQGGVAGEYVVAIVELEDGSKLAVNRGFVPVNADVELAEVPVGSTIINGWLQESVVKGRFGVDDSGQGVRIPRFNTTDLSQRLGEELPLVWLQRDGDETGSMSFPDPVPLPPLDGGPHLSYAGQWFIFATLGLAFYGALLRRQARSSGS